MNTEGLKSQVELLVKRVTQLENQLEMTSEKLIELAKASNDRMHRLQNTIEKVQFEVKSDGELFRNKLIELSGGLGQNKVREGRVEALAQKHSTAVEKFEERLQELKKQVMGQDFKIIEMSSQIKDLDFK